MIRNLSTFARTVSIGVFCVVAIAALPAEAETPEEKGRAIAVEMDRRDLGWNDSTTSMTMVLSNAPT